jgi:hypothetical protein
MVQALAVDNEPEPFWTGAGQEEGVAAWKAGCGWNDAWGTAEPVGNLNGPSGAWLQSNVLAPFAVNRANAWITDCLDTYRASVAMRSAVESVYEPFALTHGLPSAVLAEHPSENAIVAEAQAFHSERIRNELVAAGAQTVVTLGNAALRVFRGLLDAVAGPTKLAADETYGAGYVVALAGMTARWFPLAHPAAPPMYQSAHATWKETVAG